MTSQEMKLTKKQEASHYTGNRIHYSVRSDHWLTALSNNGGEHFLLSWAQQLRFLCTFNICSKLKINQTLKHTSLTTSTHLVHQVRVVMDTNSVMNEALM